MTKNPKIAANVTVTVTSEGNPRFGQTGRTTFRSEPMSPKNRIQVVEVLFPDGESFAFLTMQLEVA